jgi:hypothetical protein
MLTSQAISATAERIVVNGASIQRQGRLLSTNGIFPPFALSSTNGIFPPFALSSAKRVSKGSPSGKENQA